MAALPLERAKCGIRAGSLARHHLRRPSDPSEIAQLPKALPYAVDAVSASGGNKDAIGRRPAHLFINLEGDGLETFNAERIRITSARAKDGTGIVIASLEKLAEKRFLITAANHLGAVRSHERELRGGRIRVAENDAVPVCSGGIGSGCASVVSSADGCGRREPKCNGHRNRHAVRTVLPRPGGVRGFILEQDIHAFTVAAKWKQRCPAFTEADARLLSDRRQQPSPSPQARCGIGDAARAYFREVIGNF